MFKVLFLSSLVYQTYGTSCTGYPSASSLGRSFTSIQEAVSLARSGENDEIQVKGIVTNDLRDTPFNLFVLQAPSSQTDSDFSDFSQAIEIYCDTNACSNADFEEGQLISFTGTTSFYNSVRPQLTDTTNFNVETSSLTTVSSSCPSLAAEVNIVDLTLPREEAFEDILIQNMLVSVVIDESEDLADGTLTLADTYDFEFGQVVVSAIGRLIQPSSIYDPVDEASKVAARESLNTRSSLVLDDRTSYACPSTTPWFDTELIGGGLRTGGKLDPSVLDATGTYQYLTGADSFMFRPTEFGESLVTINAFDQSENERVSSIELSENSPSGLRIASFNMLNYFTTFIEEDDCSDCRGADTSEEFELQSSKLYNGILELDAAVFGLQEVQNIDLETGSSDDVTMDLLVSELNELAGSDKFAYIETGELGSDAIRVAMIYQPDLVTPEGSFQSLDFINPTAKSRTALAQTFSVNSVNGGCLRNSELSSFTLVNLHFKSKGSACDEDDSSNSDYANRVAAESNCGYTRLKHSNQLIDWLQGGDFDSNVPQIILGDLNSYGSERVLKNLEDNGFTQLSGNSADDPTYSYTFGGLFGSLDHVLISDFAASATGETYKWHINSDEAIVTDYTEEMYSSSFCDSTPSGYQDESYFRSSDHDPAINFFATCGE
eukprot:snap_masked-scaffold_14-processed-gene-4.23-mRNA-1 protein AED:0.97 eAED:1.00 QI:0/-1/0/1/-1/1/1/0/661